MGGGGRSVAPEAHAPEQGHGAAAGAYHVAMIASGFPASQQALKWAGRDLLCSVPSGRHIGVSRVGQATVHSADLPREPADALSSALTGHGGNRSEASGTPGVGWASRAGFTNAASVATALSGR